MHERLRESVQLHLRSDVPVGAALSAGIDSSSVTALMAQMLPDPVQTFTLRFDEPGFDELRTQKALDEYPEYGLAGHRIPCQRSDMERMPDAVWHGEDLLLGGVVMGLMMMAESAESSVKVLLTGEGADEVFGGYSWYPTTRVLAPLFALPRSVRRLLSEIPPIRRRWPGAAGMIAGPRAIDFERYSRSISHLYSQAAHARLLSASVRDGDFRLKDVSFPVTRPEVKLFIERLSRQYRSACGEQLIVTSLTRPVANQPRNASPLSVHPTGMALDLRRPRNRACRRWIEDTLLHLESRGVLDATRERRPPHYHVALFPQEYAAYVARIGNRVDRPAKTSDGLRHTVRRRDSLWLLSRRYGTTIRAIQRANDLISSVIHPGQVLSIPVAMAASR